MFKRLWKTGQEKSKSAEEQLLDRLVAFGKREPTLEDLRQLYLEDPELLFQLATIGVPKHAPEWAKQFYDSSIRLREIVQNGFDVSLTENGTAHIVSGDITETVASEDIPAIVEFLNTLNDTSEGREAVDYEGEDATAAEAEFVMGDRFGVRRGRVLQWMNAKPIVLRVDETDLSAVVGGMPGYVVYGLARCVPQVVMAPTVVFEGIRGSGDLMHGRAYCGLPKHFYDNSGNPLPLPTGMVYVVYSDAQGYVFDWDWVQESETPGFPVDWTDRFSRVLQNPAEATPVLDLPEIKPTEFRQAVWYSRRGDCMFWYRSDALAFAERINEDFTVFRALDSKEPVGCKFKNVSRNIREMRMNVLQLFGDAPTPLKVIVASSLVKHAAMGASAGDYEVYQRVLGDVVREADVHAGTNLFHEVD